MRLLYPLIILTLLVAPKDGFGQNHLPINGDFSRLTFDQFVKAIEAKTDYHFYYNKAYTDSLSVNLIAENKSIEKILDEITNGTNLHYAIDPDNNIYITLQRQILTELPVGFLVPETMRPNKRLSTILIMREKRSKRD